MYPAGNVNTPAAADRPPRPARPTWAIRRVAHIREELLTLGGAERVMYTLTPRRPAPGAPGLDWRLLSRERKAELKAEARSIEVTPGGTRE